MKTTTTKPNSKFQVARTAAPLLLASIVSLNFALSPAQAYQRPLEDFLSAQGDFGGYFGWADPASGNTVLFDYAGVDNAFLLAAGLPSVGTTFSGSVTEIPLADGRAKVHVIPQTWKALVNAFDSEFNLLFGNGPFHILEGGQPSLGDSTLEVTFINTAPRAALPDLQAVAFRDFIFGSICGQSSGTLADGSAGRLEVTQTGLIATYFKVNANSRVALDGFPAEHILIRPTGK